MKTSIADHVGPQLPYLRRFARALGGSQDCGDAYVVSTLEAIVADQRNFDRLLDPRVALYQIFLRIWNAMPFNAEVEQVDRDKFHIVDKRIETITPLARQAFLLAAIEEFTAGDIAVILRRSESDVEALLDQAGKEIADQISARVLIIEDEPLIALDIENLVREIGHDVVAIASTHKEATAEARRTRPELVLADIQLADGSSGIDAVNEILEDANIPVIFITAYPERLLTGERPEPAFLMTKPFRSEMVKAVISQALFFDVKAGRNRSDAAA